MNRTLLTPTRFLLLAAYVVFGTGVVCAQVATFNELPLSAESYWNGPDESVTPETVTSWGDTGTVYAGSFTSGGVDFANTYTTWENYTPGNTGDDYSSWEGWAYSNITDITTAGIGNQYSAYATPNGGGYGGSGNYGIFFAGYDDLAPTINFDAPTVVSSAYLTNTTYAYLAVVDGNDGGANFVKGPFAQDDWFKVTVWGFDAEGEATTSLDIYLADYRDSDSDNWYALDEWTQFDLSSLGEISGLGFELSSTDSGSWGMNTPGYFAMDNLALGAIPEPSALLLLLCGGLVGLTSLRRRGPRGR